MINSEILKLELKFLYFITKIRGRRNYRNILCYFVLWQCCRNLIILIIFYISYIFGPRNGSPNVVVLVGVLVFIRFSNP